MLVLGYAGLFESDQYFTREQLEEQLVESTGTVVLANAEDCGVCHVV
jgi:hypothetical protein